MTNKSEAEIKSCPFCGTEAILFNYSKELGRDYIGIEINHKYCEIAQRRLAQDYLFT